LEQSRSTGIKNRSAVLKGHIMQKEETQIADGDNEVLLFEISDAELERAAGMNTAAFTLGNCTGLGTCPS
jgi:hypothetical protein